MGRPRWSAGKERREASVQIGPLVLLAAQEWKELGQVMEGREESALGWLRKEQARPRGRAHWATAEGEQAG